MNNLAFPLTERAIAIFDEIAKMPTPSPHKNLSARTPLPKLKYYPLSPSPVTELSSPTPLSSKSQPTLEEYTLLQKEKVDAEEKTFDLQERLEHSLRMQEVAEEKAASLEMKLKEALTEISRLRTFMEAEGKKLIRGSYSA